MKRKIITIDEEKCTGCGLCIPDCPEGALQILNGKARLISDLFCDGLGACIGTCPEGAITVIEREAGAYNEKTVMKNIASQGETVIIAHLEHLNGHGQTELYNEAIEFLNDNKIAIPKHKTMQGNPPPHQSDQNPFIGCPGAAAQSITRITPSRGNTTSGSLESELRQWPIQLALLNPAASYFDGADLLVSADCTPFAYADFHRNYLRGKILVMFCPKLDVDIEGYITKMSDIFTHHTIQSVTALHMEVPCCSGITYVINEALKRSGKQIPVKEITITIQGQIR